MNFCGATLLNIGMFCFVTAAGVTLTNEGLKKPEMEQKHRILHDFPSENTFVCPSIENGSWEKKLNLGPWGYTMCNYYYYYCYYLYEKHILQK